MPSWLLGSEGIFKRLGPPSVPAGAYSWPRDALRLLSCISSFPRLVGRRITVCSVPPVACLASSLLFVAVLTTPPRHFFHRQNSHRFLLFCKATLHERRNSKVAGCTLNARMLSMPLIRFHFGDPPTVHVRSSIFFY